MSANVEHMLMQLMQKSERDFWLAIRATLASLIRTIEKRYRLDTMLMNQKDREALKRCK